MLSLLLLLLFIVTMNFSAKLSFSSYIVVTQCCIKKNWAHQQWAVSSERKGILRLSQLKQSPAGKIRVSHWVQSAEGGGDVKRFGKGIGMGMGKGSSDKKDVIIMWLCNMFLFIRGLLFILLDFELNAFGRISDTDIFPSSSLPTVQPLSLNNHVFYASNFVKLFIWYTYSLLYVIHIT